MSERRLAAIMFTDITGYTALMGKDEDRAVKMLQINREIHSRLLEKHHGTLIKEMGDGILTSFHSSFDAVKCALEIQSESKKNEIPLKIGIHEGDMIFEGDDVIGDGVNIAARLQDITETGWISASESIYKNVKNKPGIYTAYIGEKFLKNVEEPVKVFNVSDVEIIEEIKPTLEKTKSRKIIPYILLGGIIATIIVVILILRNLPEKQPVADDLAGLIVKKSMAVLPFKDLSPEKDNQYFCDVIKESILNDLQKISELVVKSSQSTEKYRNSDIDIPTIGRELDANYILEGNVFEFGEQFRITVQLIEAESDNHLWSDAYDGTYTDEILTFLSNTSKEIAKKLDVAVTPQEKGRIEYGTQINMEAYDLVIRANQERQNMHRFPRFVKKHFEASLAFLDQALEIEPHYANALAGKGHTYFWMGLFDSAIIYCDRALAINPDNFEAYFVKGDLYQYVPGKTDLEIENLTKAVQLSPSNTWANFLLGKVYWLKKQDVFRAWPYLKKAIEVRGISKKDIYREIFWVTYMSIGDYVKAERFLKNTTQWEDSCDAIWPFAWVYFFQKDYDKALDYLDSVCDIFNCGWQCQKQYWLCFNRQLKFKEAEKIYNRYIEAGYWLYPHDSLDLAFMYKNLGEKDKAEFILNKLQIHFESLYKKNNENFRVAFTLAIIFAIKDEKEEALRYLKRTIDLGGMNVHMLQIEDYVFISLRDDPDFKFLLNHQKEKFSVLRAQLQELEDRGEFEF